MKKSIFIIIFALFFLNKFVYAESLENISKIQEEAKENIAEGVDLEKYISTINEYIEESKIEGIDIYEISNNLVSNEKIDYENILLKIVNMFFKELKGTLTSTISIFIIILIIAVISSLELEEKSDITKIAHLACFFTLSTITISNFLEIITMFKNTVSTLTTIMQVVSPFLMGVLLATGSISTTGIIQPILLFIASTVGFIINYIVIPFLSISVALNVISTISESLKFNKLAKFFNNASLWIIGVTFTIFLGVLSLETSLTTSVDSLAIKTTQTAVSNFVPVVGKFFSDSFETVVGATKIISNVGGILGIITIIIIAIVPVLKLTVITLIYSLLSAIIEPICNNESITKYISGFVGIYKTLLGILIGISILFIISTGIILNLVGQVIN